MLIISALLLLFYNMNESKEAGEAAEKVLTTVEEAIKENANKATESETELKSELPTVNIDGYDYVGYIEIPKISIKLPIISDWDYDKLKIAPCRHFGSSRTDNLVIAGHNYTTHFGKLDNLTQGDSVVFTDMDGIVNSYQVEKTETVDPNNVDYILNSGYDLVLYTCTLDGSNRTTVFCNRVEIGN